MCHPYRGFTNNTVLYVKSLFMSTIVSGNPLNHNTCVCRINQSKICRSLRGTYNITKYFKLVWIHWNLELIKIILTNFYHLCSIIQNINWCKQTWINRQYIIVLNCLMIIEFWFWLNKYVLYILHIFSILYIVCYNVLYQQYQYKLY